MPTSIPEINPTAEDIRDAVNRLLAGINQQRLARRLTEAAE